MAVDDPDSIDIVSTARATGEVVLTISDHLPWDDANQHLLILQNKINRYLEFIDSGQLAEAYPNAKPGVPVRINVVCKNEPSSDAERFLRLVRDKIESSGRRLSWSWRPEGEPAQQADEPDAAVVAGAPTAVPSLAKNARSAQVIGRSLCRCPVQRSLDVEWGKDHS